MALCCVTTAPTTLAALHIEGTGPTRLRPAPGRCRKRVAGQRASPVVLRVVFGDARCWGLFTAAGGDAGEVARHGWGGTATRSRTGRGRRRGGSAPAVTASGPPASAASCIRAKPDAANNAARDFLRTGRPGREEAAGGGGAKPSSGPTLLKAPFLNLAAAWMAAMPIIAARRRGRIGVPAGSGGGTGGPPAREGTALPVPEGAVPGLGDHPARRRRVTAALLWSPPPGAGDT